MPAHVRTLHPFVVRSAALAIAAALASAPAAAAPAAPAPTLDYAFTARVTVAPPVETGNVEGSRRRFIAITGGTVSGPLFTGTVLPGGGDWQAIGPDGVVRVEARYFLKAADGTVVEADTPGIRVADPAVTERIARGERVDPSAYYFRLSPSFRAGAGPYAWLGRSTFVARGVRFPDHVEIDVYVVR